MQKPTRYQILKSDIVCLDCSKNTKKKEEKKKEEKTKLRDKYTRK